MSKRHPFTDTWPEPLSVGKQYLRDVGETPDSMRHHKLRERAAIDKRAARVARNIRNEAAQGNLPEGLYLVGGRYTADCKQCRQSYVVDDVETFNVDVSYCGNNQWCVP